MEQLRKIEALVALTRDDLKEAVEPGKEPEWRWVDPTDLYVDEEYQRSLRRRSLSLIAGIVKNFKWRRCKPPICVELEDGTLHCIDGQHTAIAAATVAKLTGAIKQIPIVVVEADSVELRADAFVGHNRDRIVMDPLDVYKGLLKAGDPDAQDVANVCSSVGIRIRQLQVAVAMKPGDCAAVNVISNLIKRHSPLKARKVLRALVLAERAPISRVEIDATEAMMLVKCPDITPEQMASVIRAVNTEGLIRAKMNSVQEKVPHKHKLFEEYLRVWEKQRAA